MATGSPLSPSPRLALTNIAWGYLARWLADIGTLEPYTLMTYAALGVSYLAVLYALVRSDVNKLFAAATLLIIYGHALVYPQYTLVAGYLAFAGIALLCIPPVRQSVVGVYIAGLLFVVSGLVRADETVLVIIIALPACIGYWRAAAGSGIRRHWSIMTGASVAAFAAFQLLDAYSFSSGQWSEFGKTYMLRTEFTDFNLAGYYRAHKGLLDASGYSLNDLGLFSNWFYMDTQVFSPERLGQLSAHLSWQGRMEANLGLSHEVFKPFFSPQVCGLLVITLLTAIYHQRRTYLLTSLLTLAAVMFALLLLGRPGVTRIYIPACAALALIGLMQPVASGKRSYALPVMIAVAGSVLLLMVLHGRNKAGYRIVCRSAGRHLRAVARTTGGDLGRRLPIYPAISSLRRHG